jgi:hypothetical protein
MTTFQLPVIFLGPTLNRAIAARICSADFRPPAAMGDVTRAAEVGAETIVLIDGVFEDRPSVWHKEILWALSNGIGVVGAASMSALRAAELHDHGMLGHGEIYEAYASGEITDDDEVAVVHGPAETGFMPLTDAMVDIRDAIGQAKAVGVLTPAAAEATIACAKAQHFKVRNLNKVVQSVLLQSHSSLQMKEILTWFANRPAGAKARDALDLLKNLDSISAKARNLSRDAPRFIPTIYLSRLETFGYRQP